MDRPIIAVVTGDPAGIGPELVVRVLSQESNYQRCHPFVIGDARVLQDACNLLNSPLQIRAIRDLGEAAFRPGLIDLIRPTNLSLDSVVLGQVDPAMGKAAVQCLIAAYDMARVGQVQGVLLAPVNKQAINLAGYKYHDDLELLADLTSSPEPYLVGAVNPALWTIAVTTHLPFRQIAELITRDNVLKSIRRLEATLRKVGFARPRIAVAALNVHGGEGGLFGREEIDEIIPAIEQAQAVGLNVAGACPADTVFVRAREGEFDGVVSMYHDQANIARKLLATMRGATIYMGLPVVCGTTAHGTAFDKAGKAVADPSSLQDALEYVMMLST